MKKLKEIEEEIKYYDECFNNISHIFKVKRKFTYNISFNSNLK